MYIKRSYLGKGVFSFPPRECWLVEVLDCIEELR